MNLLSYDESVMIGEQKPIIADQSRSIAAPANRKKEGQNLTPFHNFNLWPELVQI
jgi:hypothetical protein